MKTFAILAFIIVAVCCTRGQARAACSGIDASLTTAQGALRAAEPARDASVADFARRLGLVATARDATLAAETTRETTPGGCGDLQQLYSVLMTSAWVELELAYFKPSIDFYVAAGDCREVSQLETVSAVADAYEIMNRSLISWNPVSAQTIATRDHVTQMAIAAAAYLQVALPAPESAETLARSQKFRLDVARSRATTDCIAALPEVVPRTIARMIFSGS